MSDDTAAITINDVPHTVLCGFCKSPIAKRAETEADASEWGCDACGNWDSQDEVAKLTIEYAKIEGQLQLNRIAQGVANKSRIMQFSGQTHHNQTHRFVVEMKL